MQKVIKKVKATVASTKTRTASPTAAKKGNAITIELLNPAAKQVCVAGSFNEWQPDKTPLKQKGNGRWVGDLTVTPGRHEYLFVVDGQWLPDPNAKESVQNPFGGKNSVLIVSA
jgi:1,4-alpha-glucan branching enzyme